MQESTSFLKLIYILFVLDQITQTLSHCHYCSLVPLQAVLDQLQMQYHAFLKKAELSINITNSLSLFSWQENAFFSMLGLLKDRK